MKTNSSWLRNMMVFIGIIITLIIGWGAVVFQIHDGIKADAQQKLDRARERIDIAINHASQVATSFKGNYPFNCTETTLQALRQLIVNAPDVRSINLARDNEIYCASHYGPVKEKIDSSQYIDGKLILLNGNRTTPYRSILVYRNEDNAFSVLVGIDGYHIYNVLSLLSDDKYPVYFRIGNKWMGLDGVVHDKPFQASKNVLSSSSWIYNFNVFMIQPPLISWSNLIEYAWGTLILFSFTCIISFLIAWRIIRYSSSPESAIRSALIDKQFIPYMQPIVDAKTFRVVGAEVLSRWKHPVDGIIPPDSFIPLAEKTGLIINITSDILISLAEFINSYKNLIGRDFLCCVNVSASHFQSEKFLHSVERFISATSEAPIVLVLELTERELIEDNQRSAVISSSLSKAGVVFAIDDYGTGNANLAYLKQFSAKILKIDKLFTAEANSEHFSSEIVDNIISLSERLSISTVAEGIETAEQALYFRKSGVTWLQGYYFSRPMPLADFGERILSYAMLPLPLATTAKK